MRISILGLLKLVDAAVDVLCPDLTCGVCRHDEHGDVDEIFCDYVTEKG
jgi:hypothetical protein